MGYFYHVHAWKVDCLKEVCHFKLRGSYDDSHASVNYLVYILIRVHGRAIADIKIIYFILVTHPALRCNLLIEIIFYTNHAWKTTNTVALKLKIG